MDKMVKTPQIILIDGPAGSGKTTLSLKLKSEVSSELSCEVIHLDTIYNGWDDALTETLTNNLRSLLDSFLAREPFNLAQYNWATKSFDSHRLIQPTDLLIIEGVGAGQAAIRTFATTLYWVEVDDEIGMKRVLERDGTEIFQEMKIWKLREAEHFAKERTREFADFIISTA